MPTILSNRKPIVIVGIIALTVICALLVYGILVTPARQPYRDALTQYNNTNNALDRTSIALNSSTATDEDFAKNIQMVKNSLTTLKTEYEALGKQPVLASGEGKKLYDAYKDRLAAYIAYDTDVLTSVEKVRPIFRACSSVMSDVTESVEGAAATRDCANKMQAVGKLPDADYAELATAFITNYTALADIFNQMNALAEPRGVDAARQAELEAQQTTILETYATASTAFSTNVQQNRTSILTTDTATKLKKYLEDRSRIF